MFRIAVCDDQTQICRTIIGKLNRYRVQHGLNQEEWEIKAFASGVKVLEEEESFDLYFLDLEMPELDGIVVAERLRKKWKECTIIILTSYTERMKEGYKVHAFRYMTKPLSAEELAEGLDAFFESRIGYEVIQVHRLGCNHEIRQRDIRYLCRENNETIIYAHGLRFRSSKSLYDWEKELNQVMFFRCHKGYLVNLGQIEDIQKEVHLITGEKIPIARRKKVPLLECSTDFDLKYGR